MLPVPIVLKSRERSAGTLPDEPRLRADTDANQRSHIGGWKYDGIAPLAGRQDAIRNFLGETTAAELRLAQATVKAMRTETRQMAGGAGPAAAEAGRHDADSRRNARSIPCLSSFTLPVRS
jgi:hypothetical protein